MIQTYKLEILYYLRIILKILKKCHLSQSKTIKTYKLDVLDYFNFYFLKNIQKMDI